MKILYDEESFLNFDPYEGNQNATVFNKCIIMLTILILETTT